MRYKLVALAVLIMCVVAMGTSSAIAHARSQPAGTCALSVNGSGDLIASGSGWASSTTYEGEVFAAYSSPLGFGGGASVGLNPFGTDTSGAFNDDLGPLSSYTNVYPGETQLTFIVHPSHRLSTVLCTSAPLPL